MPTFKHIEDFDLADDPSPYKLMYNGEKYIFLDNKQRKVLENTDMDQIIEDLHTMVGTDPQNPL